MANKEGTSKRKRHRPLKYLYLNGTLHRSLQINRGEDTIVLWSYPSAKRVGYTYSDVKKRMEKAFTTAEAAKMLNRNVITLHRALAANQIERPQYTYGLDDPERTIFQFMWHEKNILEMHALLASRHAAGGNLRKDGLVTPKALPTVRELRAMIRNNTVLYVKTDSGFLPTWQAEQF